MPWTCNACKASVEDDVSPDCPSCGSKKTAWTLVQDKTRTMVVGTKKRFECLRGAGAQPIGHQDEYAGAEWTPTEVLPAMSVAAARALLASGALPSPRDVLVIREYPGATKAREVTVTIEFAGSRAKDHQVPGPPDALSAAGSVDARVLAVWGVEAPGEALHFEGLTVLDVTEGSSAAPSVQVTALKRPAQRLRVTTASGLIAGRVELEVGRTFPSPAAIPVLNAVLHRLRESPSLQLVVVGHGDERGSAEVEATIARARAGAIRELVTGDIDALVSRFQEPDALIDWGWEEVQWMLSAIPTPLGGPCYAGAVDGMPGKMTEQALAFFQVRAGLPISHDCPEDVLRRIVEDYAALLQGDRPPAERVIVLEGGALDARRLGPSDPGKRNEGAGVVELFLGDSFEPKVDAWQAEPRATNEQWCAAVTEVISGDSPTVVARVVDSLRRPWCAREVSLLRIADGVESEVSRPTTTASGCLELTVPAGLYAITGQAAGSPFRYDFVIEPGRSKGFTVVIDEVETAQDEVEDAPPAGAPGSLIAGRLAPSFTTRKTFPRPSALPTLKDVIDRMEADPTLQLVLIGHTDATSAESSPALSRARAEAVKALVLGDVDGLLACFEQPLPIVEWGWEEVQWMLSAIPTVLGDPCYVGAIDGIPGRITEKALALFQVREGLPICHSCPPATLRRIVEVYAGLLGAAPRPAADRVVALGGAHHHPPSPFGQAPAAVAETDGEARRRVEVILGATLSPPPSSWTGEVGADATYAAWCRASSGELAAPATRPIVLRLVDALRRPKVDLEVELFQIVPGAEPLALGRQTTGATGCLTVDRPAGLYAIEADIDDRRFSYQFLAERGDAAGFSVVV